MRVNRYSSQILVTTVTEASSGHFKICQLSKQDKGLAYELVLIINALARAFLPPAGKYKGVRGLTLAIRARSLENLPPTRLKSFQVQENASLMVLKCGPVCQLAKGAKDLG